MKKAKVVSALITITALCGWIAIASSSAAAQAQAPAQQQASPWKDRAEYDKFNAILQATDSNQKIELADQYLAAYPQSKVADKVYEIKLQAYQQLNKIPEVQQTANKLLEINPKNVYALFLLSTLFPQTFAATAESPDADQKLNTAADHAKAGLAETAVLPKPPNVSDDDFKKQKDQLDATFHETLGFVALQKKDYDQAQQELQTAVGLNPNDSVGFYRLGLSYMSPKPPKYDQGIWALARSISITGQTALPPPMQKTVKDYLSQVYEAHHGSSDGLDQVITQAASSPTPPEGFHVLTAQEMQPPEPEPAPQPAPEPKRELTVKPEELSDFGIIQKYLQAGGQKEADTWTILKGATLPLPGKVVSATPPSKPKTILLAVSPELQTQDGKYDVEVNLASPSAKPIEKGETIQVEGVVDSYHSKPFLIKLANAKITK